MSYKKFRKKDKYANIIKKIKYKISDAHQRQDKTAKEFEEFAESILYNPVVQSMKKYGHHGTTSCFDHSVHVAYYNYLLCKKFHLDVWSATKGGLLHDLFLYDWHDYTPSKEERLHGFEHPSKALSNSHKHFKLTRKQGDIISKHMFPLTFMPPRYWETAVIIGTDKFCSVCEVIDGKVRGRRR